MTYDELFDCILNAKDLICLKKGMKEFILSYLAMEHDVNFVSVLSDKLEEKKDSPIHILLYSYLNSPESFVDLDFELMGFEFECNSWEKINKKISYQIKKEDFLNYLDIFEKRYQLRQAIEKHYELNIVETDLEPKFATSTCIIKGNLINVLLPRCDKRMDKESALSVIFSRIIIEVISRKLSGYRVNTVLKRFIPNIDEYNSRIFNGLLKEVIMAAEEIELEKQQTETADENQELFQIISNELKIPNEEYVDVDW